MAAQYSLCEFIPFCASLHLLMGTGALPLSCHEHGYKGPLSSFPLAVGRVGLPGHGVCVFPAIEVAAGRTDRQAVRNWLWRPGSWGSAGRWHLAGPLQGAGGPEAVGGPSGGTLPLCPSRLCSPISAASTKVTPHPCPAQTPQQAGSRSHKPAEKKGE